MQNGRDDRRIAAALFVTAFCAYAYFFSGGGWNQNAQFALTRSLVERHSISIEPYAVATGDVARSNGRLFANKAPGTSFLAVVPYGPLHAIAKAIGADVRSFSFTNLAAYVSTVFVCGLAGATLAPLVFLYARRRLAAPRRWAAAVAFALFCGTNIFAFSTMLYAHVPSTAAQFAAFFLAVSGGSLAVAGFLAGTAVATNYLLAPLLVLLALLLAWRDRSLKKIFSFGAGAVVPLAILGVYHWIAFGSPFSTSMKTMNPSFISERALFLGIIEPPDLTALYGITLSPYRGLFYLSPFLLLAILGVVRFWRRTDLRLDFVYACALFAFLLLFNVSFNGWEGGFAIGPRYLIPAIPFLGLFVAAAEPRRLAVILFAVLAAVSCANNIAAVAVDPQPSGSIAAPLEGYIYPLLLTGSYPRETLEYRQWRPELYDGHTSVNRQTMLEPAPFTRFRPRSREAEWASFNLGELLVGPGRPSSVLPLVVLLIASALFLWRASRRAE